MSGFLYCPKDFCQNGEKNIAIVEKSCNTINAGSLLEPLFLLKSTKNQIFLRP